MKKVLVTGANGFIGMEVVRCLRGSGYEVHGLIRPNSSLSEEDVIWHEYLDIGDQAGSLAALKGMHAVVHLAARVHQMKDKSENPLEEFRRVNVEGTLRLAEAAVQAGVQRFVYVSSIKADFNHDAASINVADPYGLSKRESEEKLIHFASKTGLEVVIFRPCLIYGPGVKANFLSLLKAATSGIPLPLGNIKNKRSYLFIHNFTHAIEHSLQSAQGVGKVLPLSDGSDVSTTDLIRMIAAAAGTKARLFFIPGLLTFAGRLTRRSAAVERLVGSLTVASNQTQAELQWKPPFTMEEGIAHTVEWFLHEKKARHSYV